MNNLSWFIYLADLLPALSGLLHGLAIFLLIICASITGWAWFRVDKLNESIEPNYYRMALPDGLREEFKNERASVIKTGKFLVASLGMAAIISLGVSTAIPSRNTIILIGASEFGERLIANPSVNGIVDPSIELLKTWIEQQTKQIRDGK